MVRDLNKRVAELEKSRFPDGTYWPMIRHMDKDGNEHRWASEQQPPKGKENRLILPRYAYGTPDCNVCTPNGLCTLMYCPAGPNEESWTLDFCFLHGGETRVLHSKAKQ